MEEVDRLFWALSIVRRTGTCQHLTLPAECPASLHCRTQSMSCTVLVGSILSKDALPPPLFLFRYIIYLG